MTSGWTLAVLRMSERLSGRTLRKKLFGLSHSAVSFEKRGFFAGVPGAREHLERAGGAFVDGYNAAVADSGPRRLAQELARLPADLTGFAHEGASMALALAAIVMPWSRGRWRAFVEETRASHLYLSLVGAGWALARLRLRRLPRFIADADALHAPLVYDGYGFHEAFFHPQRALWHGAARLSGEAAASFDQGAGRALWFIAGAEPFRIREAIDCVARVRRGDLWSGIGLAAAYAGGQDARGIRALLHGAHHDVHHFAQGIAFAAKARVRAGNVLPECNAVCLAVWGMDARAVADAADEELEGVRNVIVEARFAAWRAALRDRHAALQESS
jgi:hypothetical protein